ncbi:MAG: cytochrome d ubiquinol oxidase subunit II [Nitrospirota bacterium]
MTALSLEFLLAAIVLVSLIFYALTGGADYGAGVWTLFARGASSNSWGPAQRRLIGDAIGPIWEANHVWLILVVVVLFTAFPPVFSLITTRLHIPLTLALIGVVLRGATFAFRSYHVPKQAAYPGWETIFALTSLFTPLWLGVSLGAIASGALGSEADTFYAGFMRPWLAPFPFAVGLLALALFAFLAAVYLILDTKEPPLQEIFRRRALPAGWTAVGLGVIVFMLAKRGAPHIYANLTGTAWGWGLLALTALLILGAIGALWRRRYVAARLASAGSVTALLGTWALAQLPYLVEPILLADAAAPPLTLRWLLAALALGAVILFPSLYYLFLIFKGRTILQDVAAEERRAKPRG